MTYDSDIRRQRIVVLLLIAANLVMAGWMVYKREWGTAVAGVIWAVNCCFWHNTLRVQQSSRDMWRIIEAFTSLLEHR